MPFVAPAIQDAALDKLRTDATLVHLCTAEPATFAAVAGVSLGSYPAVVGANGAGAPSGRKATIAAHAPVAGHTYTGGGATPVTHYAVVSGAALLATNALAAPKNVNAGDQIQAVAFDVTILAAISAA